MVRANEIALYAAALGVHEDIDAVIEIAGDQVARTCNAPTNQAPTGPNNDAGTVGNRRGARRVSADEIALRPRA